MGMTRKHYEIVARALATTRKMYEGEEAREALAYLEGFLTEEFEVENPMFDPDIFARKSGIAA